MHRDKGIRLPISLDKRQSRATEVLSFGSSRNCLYFELPGLAISEVFAGPEDLAASFRSLYSENMALASSSRCNFR
jgi:hypothetical protein